MFFTDNPIADFDRWDAARELWRSSRPKCELCGEHIQQDGAVCIDEKWYCDNCLKKQRIWIEEDD